MSWIDRLKTATYTGPSGESIDFKYGDVSTAFDKKTSTYSFIDADGTLIQDFGVKNRRYPITAIFSGRDYDREADRFEAILSEAGRGTLDHPFYGRFDVVPVGTISRDDRLASDAGYAAIAVEFWKDLGATYPLPQIAPWLEALQFCEAFINDAAAFFAGALGLDTEGDRVSFSNDVALAVSAVSASLSGVADTTSEVQRQFEAIERSINEGLDVLIGEPLTLGAQISLLIQAPARATNLINDRLSAYGNLTAALLSGDGADVSDQRLDNRAALIDLTVGAAITGQVIASVSGDFFARPQAIAAADFIATQFDQWVGWRDENIPDDTGDAYQQVLEAVSSSVAFLVETSYSLRQERRIILNRTRTPVDLCGELYNALGTDLDLLIKSNDLSGSEIIEIPKGREIVYYI